MADSMPEKHTIPATDNTTEKPLSAHNLAVPAPSETPSNHSSTNNDTISVSSKADSLVREKSRQSNKSDQCQRPEHDADLARLNTLDRISTSDYPTASKLAFIVLALVLSIFLVSLDMTIVATAIPRITDDFHSLSDVGWYGSAFFLTVGAFQSTWGKAYKYFPLKTTFLVSIFIFEIGSLICAVAQNSVTLIVGRAIAGLGGAGIGSGAYTIIAFAAPPRQRPAFTGILGAVYGVSSVVGPLIGGAFTSEVTWRWCFYINLPIGGLSAAIILLTFQTPAASKPEEATWREKVLQMDPAGTMVILGAIICYILALQWGGTTKSWGDRDVVGCFVGFGVLIIGFAVIEYWEGDRAMLPRYIMGRRDVAVNCAYIFL